MVRLQLAMGLVLKSGVSQFPHTPEMEKAIVTAELQKDSPFPTSTPPGR